MLKEIVFRMKSEINKEKNTREAMVENFLQLLE